MTVLESFARYRTLIYLFGLVVLGGTALARPGEAVRVAVVTATLAVMTLTYGAELWTRADGVATDTLDVRLVLAVVGVAAGGYVALAVNTVAGLLFVLGAMLFLRASVRGPAPDGGSGE